MKRKWLRVTVSIIASLIILSILKDLIIKSVTVSAIRNATGLQLKIDYLHVGVLRPVIDIKGLKIFNPKDFPDRLMADMPRIYVDYDLGAMLSKKVHLRKAVFNLKQLVVEKNKSGKVNTESVKTVKKAKEERVTVQTSQSNQFRIDLLSLTVGKIIYKDYTKGEKPSIEEYNANINNQTYRDITSVDQLVSLILVKSVERTAIAGVVGVSALSAIGTAALAPIAIPFLLFKTGMDKLEGNKNQK